MIKNSGGVNKLEGLFSIDVKGGEKQKEEDPNDMGSNDWMKKIDEHKIMLTFRGSLRQVLSFKVLALFLASSWIG